MTGDEYFEPDWTIDQLVDKLDDYNLTPEQTTCWSCAFWRTCEFVFDPYNVFGDCLAEK